MVTKYGYGPLAIILGFTFLLSIFVFTAAIHWWPVLILPSLFSVFSLYFFRLPKKAPAYNAKNMLSPATGKVVEILEEVDENEFIKSKVCRITIFLSVFDCHVNVAPVKGEVIYRNHVPGKKLNALAPESSTENEYVMLGMKMDNGIKIGIRQIAGLIARRIICDTKVGALLEQAGIYGMIRFGSRTEICIPVDANFKPSVVIGDKVLCGHSIIGTFSE